MIDFLKRLWQGEDNHRMVIEVNIHDDLHDRVYAEIKGLLQSLPYLEAVREE